MPLGAPCEGSGAAAPIAELTASVVPGGTVTLVAYGVTGGRGDQAPKGAALADAPQATAEAASLRVFHAVPESPPLDVLVASAGGGHGREVRDRHWFSLHVEDGFAPIPGGAPDGTTLTLKAGAIAARFPGLPALSAGVVATSPGGS